MSSGGVRVNFPGMERLCPRCKQTIVVTEKMCQRQKYTCRQCDVAMAADYVQRNRNKKRASNNAWHAKRSAERAQATKSYRDRHPDRKAAHQAVQTAIRNGTLTKAPCGVCGSAKVHAHHDDYSQPLSVEWLCHQHHMERHSMLAARGAA
jgi:predicted RNA-binding Zn-ribbon protein involved in translation (DUF1610 family)